MFHPRSRPSFLLLFVFRFMPKGIGIIFGLSLMLGTSFVCGQEEDQTPLLRTTTRLVQVNAVVLDRGQPVNGLTQDDFDVFDNGVRQKIVHFSSSSSSVPDKPAKQSPLIISNRQGATDQPSGVTVVLVDELILDAPPGSADLSVAAQIRRVRLEVMRFLTTLKRGQQVALYALRQDGVVVIH